MHFAQSFFDNFGNVMTFRILQAELYGKKNTTQAMILICNTCTNSLNRYETYPRRVLCMLGDVEVDRCDAGP